MKSKFKFFVVISSFLLAFLTAPANAIFGVGDIVIDPTNLIQNTSTAIAAVKTEVSTAASYIKQIQQTIALARSLASVDGLAKLAGVENELALYRDLKRAGDQLVVVMNKSKQLSQNVKAEFGSSDFSWKRFLTSRSTILGNQAQSLAAQYELLNKSLTQIATRRQVIVKELEKSTGQTAAIQSVGAAIDMMVGQNQLMVATLKMQGDSKQIDVHLDDAARKAGQKVMSEYQQKLLDEAAKYDRP